MTSGNSSGKNNFAPGTRRTPCELGNTRSRYSASPWAKMSSAAPHTTRSGTVLRLSSASMPAKGFGSLASVAGFSLSHFKPLFKQAVGMPVHRFVLERRVERARSLLLQGGRTISEIALEAGFAHPSHMARCMRRLLGVGPRQVAKSLY